MIYLKISFDFIKCTMKFEQDFCRLHDQITDDFISNHFKCIS